MTAFDTVHDAAQRLTAQERVQLAFALTRDYDGRTFEALAEAWPEDSLGMAKAGRGEAGIDGNLPDGRALQVKARRPVRTATVPPTSLYPAARWRRLTTC